MTENGEPHYNPTFERFVDPTKPEVDQLAGIVAYSLYKIAKREWATDLYERLKRPPNDDELDAYIRTWTDSRVKGALEQAEGIIANFGATVVETAAPQIREEALRGTFWGGVWRGIFANALYTLLLIALVVVLAWAGVDLLSIMPKG